MSTPMAVLTFLCSWWILLFLALPFHIHPEERQSPLHYEAAPAPLRWGRLFAVTTLLALLFTGAVAVVVDSGWFHLDTL